MEKKAPPLTSITARDIMSTELTVTIPMEKVSTAEIMMIKNKIGCLPVVNPNKPNSNDLIGILTHRDIQLSRSAIGTHAFHVDDLYSKNPVIATLNEPFPKIVQKMIDYDIERIPVVNDNNQIKGIIVASDIIRALGSYFEKINKEA
jgi:tRNA nucleotidyltransferase (CCA-adding enzyme)